MQIHFNLLITLSTVILLSSFVSTASLVRADSKSNSTNQQSLPIDPFEENERLKEENEKLTKTLEIQKRYNLKEVPKKEPERFGNPFSLNEKPPTHPHQKNLAIVRKGQLKA